MGTPTEKDTYERPYRVLSIHGGGIRGIYTSVFFTRLTDQFPRIRSESALDLRRGPDLITGDTHRRDRRLCARRRSTNVGGLALDREYGPKILPHRIAGKASAAFRATQGNETQREGGLRAKWWRRDRN